MRKHLLFLLFSHIKDQCRAGFTPAAKRLFPEEKPLGRCGHRPLQTETIRLVGAAIGRPLPRCDIPQADEQCSPLQGRRTKVVSLRGAKRRGNLPVQFYDHIGTDVEATPYREIPTDGTAVLGMTYFYPGAPFWTYPALRLREGQDPPLRISPTINKKMTLRCSVILSVFPGFGC